MRFDWYAYIIREDSLEQGDFIPSCPLVIPPLQLEEGSSVEVEINKIDSIILSQSCDLLNQKLEIVLVCPYYSLTEWLELSPFNQNRKSRAKAIDNLKKGHFPSYHLLNKFENCEILNDYQVVDFRNVYGIHFKLLNSLVKKSEEKRIRLLPPYREHLSQAFARYFMRVGLPQDLIIES